MRPFSTVARPLVAAPFILTGLETIRDPGTRAEQVAPTIKPLADRMEWLPTKDPETLVRIQGALSVGAGIMLTVGRFKRLSTFLLAAQMIPTLLAEHHYWTEDDPERRADERSHLLKNASLLGALILVATEPRKGLHAAALRRQLRDTRLKAGAEAKHVRSEAKHLRKDTARQVRTARREAVRKAESGRRKAVQATALR